MNEIITDLNDFPGKIRMDRARKYPIASMGKKFGRLTVVGYTKKRGQLNYVCRCDCGKIVTTPGDPLYRGRTRSCGCLAKSMLRKRSITHGGSRTRLYRIWALMLQRCTPGTPSSRHYGDRGITVCVDWRDFSKFRDWAAGSGYGPTMTIERKDVNRGYSPENCTWIPRSRQPCNSRRSLWITLCGTTKCLSDWCREKGVKYHTAVDRLKHGWPVERLFVPPVPYDERNFHRKEGNRADTV